MNPLPGIHRIVPSIGWPVSRHEQMERFVASDRQGKPVVAIAGGQQAARGFVPV